MKIIVLGCGKIGSVIAQDLAESLDVEFTVADISESKARATAKMIGGDWIIVDIMESSELVRTLSGYDLVLGALPGDYGFKAIKAAVEAQTDMVDISFTPEDPMELNDYAKENWVTIIPDCGVAPGLSNILVGYGHSRLEDINKAHIMVGGIPETQIPPLGYTITWSAEGLIDEYVRDVHIVKDGKIIEVPALSGLEQIDFKGVGKLEAFYTDGLRTLTRTISNVDEMWEKTLRYPGHVEKIKLLKDLGYFSNETIDVDGKKVTPRKMSARLWEKKLRRPEIGDLLAMKIIVENKDNRLEFSVLDHYDREKDVSAMARTTGYTASIVAQMLAQGNIKKRGVVPPEKIGMNKKHTRTLLSELEKRKITIKESMI